MIGLGFSRQAIVGFSEHPSLAGTGPLCLKIYQGLLGRLPKSGDVWPEADRKLWLDLLAGSFKLIYKDKDEATN